MSEVRSEIVIVGGGPAGLSAAAAASPNAKVAIVDDNPLFGGQIWRAELGKIKSPDARQLIEQIDAGKVTVVNNAQVFGSVGNTLLAETPTGRLDIRFEKLVIATGARERFLPFPGWTMPNVFGAGGLQAMVKGGLSVAGKRVVVAGTGALLLAVADYLKVRGAKVVAIVEQAPAAKVNRFALGLWRSPTKLTQAAVLRAKLLGVPYLTGCWVTSASGNGKVESVALVRKGKTWDLGCDYLACGFHLVPNTELAAVMGCMIDNSLVSVDEFQKTSVDDVYSAGEPTGIGGLDSSLIEGKIAGFAATGRIDQARELFANRDQARSFGDALNTAFDLREELKTLAEPSTIVCRCEDVLFERLTQFDNFRDAKLQTRCGMGPCQGRVCGGSAEFLFGWRPPTVRQPIFPVKIENL